MNGLPSVSLGQDLTPAGGLALSRDYLLCNTFDIEEAHHRLSRIYCPYQCDTVATPLRRPVIAHNVRARKIGLSQFSYGTAVRLSPELFGDFMLITTTVSGTAEIATSRERCTGGSGMTAVLSPEHVVKLSYCGANTQFTIRIERDHLISFCDAFLGVTASPKLDFALCMNNPATAARWRTLVAYFVSLMDPQLPEPGRSLMIRQAEEMLMLTLLTGQRWSGSQQLCVEGSKVAPKAVKRAIDFIEHHAASVPTLEQIAEAAQSSIRSMQRGFADYCGKSPMQYLKEVRLRCVRQSLANPNNLETVTAVASRFGFVHFGQFAFDYRRAFGELPSETARRCR